MEKSNRILHITNDYSGSTVYRKLVAELDRLALEQIVYNPIRKTSLIGKNKINLENKNSSIMYAHILSEYVDRIFYKKKIEKILKDIESKINLKQIDIVHAHTWFSDGGVAYELHKKHNIPYIVAVRNTDLNLFFKYMVHLRKYGLEILRNASKIIFISPIYKKRFLEHKVIQLYLEVFKDKCEVIPNGVDNFWIENVQNRKLTLNKPVELLYVGSFTSNKNVLRLLKAVELLNFKEIKFNLKIIGSGGKEHNKVLRHIQGKDCFNYLGEVRDKNELKKIFQNSDIFTMPSKSETFGLVYIEAISQGLPILFARNEGIDGSYENVGEGVNPLKIKDISKGIENIINNHKEYLFTPTEIVQNHNWVKIAEKYSKFYLKFSKSK
jgi:glycosyltransferase involved in cell wall biosynthesis